MRASRLFLIAPLAAVVFLPASAQDPSSLPAAPSATLEQQAPPPPPPQSPAQHPELKKREKPSPPVLETLDPKPRPMPQPENSAAPQISNTAQNSSANEPADQAPSTVIRTTVNEVNVVFTVTDKHNRYVKDLKAADFKVLDNKLPPANIRNYASETNLPLRVGLLVDASNSIRDRFRFEQQAAIEFLNQIIHPQRDQAFVLGFDTTPAITQ